MEKFKKIASTLFYSFVLYFLTFIFVAFFTLSAQVLREWKQSEMVKVSDDRVEISGNNMLSRKEVLLISGLENEKSWFDLDERRMEAYLLSSGWVKRAFVTKLFPDSVNIVIEEFVPAIVVNSRRSSLSPNEKKDVSTLWFADSEGIVFKRTFPGETTAALPFFHIDNDAVSEKLRGEKIVTAVMISKAWNDQRSMCSIKSIKFDMSSGFSADCEAPDSMTTYLAFGNEFSNNEISTMKEMFSNISGKLSSENKWAGEYIFEKTEKDKKIRVIVGKVFKNVNRGSNA
ncbi:MAG TPA: FtsQ-type POTRA domain-containing protein [bacterium]|jgi:hypothetical protein|nr:FtsQ-type POTRA domain-containing protein [bacterium]MDX9804299.1 FtsQ-type POTRA domain-containing protein [bacterium]HNW16213.1 FtsQ-type POTRA domain-containing protein [bacterium]HOB71143.1 FtsQ-type POTRA domain-containing protein [bacterium]HPM45460.1 FtsQ-type POTRA domain-containing protein [bacterium]